jgi:hypothetical protein
VDWPFLAATVLVWILWPIDIAWRWLWRLVCLVAFVLGGRRL